MVRNIFLMLKSLKISDRVLTLNNRREYRGEGSRIRVRVRINTILYAKCIVCQKKKDN